MGKAKADGVDRYKENLRCMTKTKDRIEISMFSFDQIEIVCDHVNFLPFHPCEFFNVCNLIRG